MSRQIDREELLTDLRELADGLGKSPTKKEYNEYGEYSVSSVQNQFGSWNEGLKAAGLDPNLEHNISKEEIHADIERVAGVLGKTPTLTEMDQYGKYSKLTYQTKLDSYIATLEDLGLQPSSIQYNFSSQERPPEMEGTKNVRKLRRDGPTAISELPLASTGANDKQHGLTKFSISSGQTGQGMSEPVYYLFDEHDPEDVIREFLEVNPQLLENRTRKAIVEDVGNHGSEWSDAVKSVLDDIGPE